MSYEPFNVDLKSNQFKHFSLDHILEKQSKMQEQIDTINRTLGLQGYLSENPPIGILQHNKILITKISEILTDFRKFYESQKRYMGEWFDKQFYEFMDEMEAKHLK